VTAAADQLAVAAQRLADSIRWTPLGLGPLQNLTALDAALREYTAAKHAEGVAKHN
jgi:hypothetical protein